MPCSVETEKPEKCWGLDFGIIWNYIILRAFYCSRWQHCTCESFSTLKLTKFLISNCKVWAVRLVQVHILQYFTVISRRFAAFWHRLAFRNRGSCCLRLNPLNAELNPICHLLALLGPHHIFHVSGLRVMEYNWTHFCLPEDGTSLSAETVTLSLQSDQFQPSEPEKLHAVDYLRKKIFSNRNNFYCFQKSNFRKTVQFLITSAWIPPWGISTLTKALFSGKEACEVQWPGELCRR